MNLHAPLLPIARILLPDLLAGFYALVRADAELGPIFKRSVPDWSDYLEQLERSWLSALSGSRATGDVLAARLLRADQASPAARQRWLELWRLTTDTFAPSGLAAMLQTLARRMIPQTP